MVDMAFGSDGPLESITRMPVAVPSPLKRCLQLKSAGREPNSTVPTSNVLM
jgi:hypothetical protein